MEDQSLPRRDFLKMLAAAFPAAAIDWSVFPTGQQSKESPDSYDAIIIGSGLAGLSCAAAFARQGFKPLVIEQHDKPGGFATAFSRPGGFLFDVSLHSTTVGQRDGIWNLINGFPEITNVEFLPHPTLYRDIYPDYDIRVPQRDLAGYIKILQGLFQEDREIIAGVFEDMKGLFQDVMKISAAHGNVDMSRFPVDFPYLFKFHDKTWGEFLDTRVKNPRLKAVLSGQWAYYGLPPSKLSCYYYALPFLGYLTGGGFYPKGRSQDISNAFAAYIQSHGGKLILNSKVRRIIVKDAIAGGVVTADGKEFRSRVVVSNANPFDTFEKMIADQSMRAAAESHWKDYSVSLSGFQVFLGLKKDLIRESGQRDSEIFTVPSYDPEMSYQHALQGDVEKMGFALTLYDNIYPGYSAAGRNTINIMTLQGYGPWERYEKDYFAGNKSDYVKEKERIADILIDKVEGSLLPGLRNAIEVREIGTPLTVVRYTGHYRGAIYGWDQTVNNSGSLRVGHTTPIKNLFLAGAWSRPGHGYGAVIPSGLECFTEIMNNW